MKLDEEMYNILKEIEFDGEWGCCVCLNTIEWKGEDGRYRSRWLGESEHVPDCKLKEVLKKYEAKT